MNRSLFLALALIPASVALAQPAAKLTFEVATVKKADFPEPGKPVIFGRRGGPGTNDPGQITWNNASLQNILTAAYDVKPYQVSGPDWLDSERFDFVAKVPAGATKEQVNMMWQNLLAERFGLTLHRVSKVFQVEEMVPAKGGVKLKETTLDATATEPLQSAQAPPPPPPPPAGAIVSGRGPGPNGRGVFPGGPQLDKNGVPQLKAPGLMMMMTMGTSGPTAHMVGKAQTMEQLASTLSNQLNRPVIDKTGLTARYDFVVEFAPDFAAMRLGAGVPAPPPGAPAGDAGGFPNASEPNGVPLIGALQQQMGLRLVSAKAPLDVLVIDKAEKVPTEN